MHEQTVPEGYQVKEVGTNDAFLGQRDSSYLDIYSNANPICSDEEFGLITSSPTERTASPDKEYHL